MQTAELAPGHRISRVIKGGWQLAGGHGVVDRTASLADMAAFYQAGITTFDCADIYTGVEELIGAFRRDYADRHGAEALSALRVHTKFVPDLSLLPTITRADVVRVIDTSLRRLGTDALDLVQFHWWDYAAPRMLDAALWLTELRTAGKVRRIGGTNFDVEHMRTLIESGVPFVSMQVQYSLLDDRPARGMAAAAAASGVRLIAYGTVAGGLLSDRWHGASEPRPPTDNRSLAKYLLIVEEAGGWRQLQRLLAALRRVADRHDTDIATVASAWVLGRPNVAAVIVGARDRAHLARNLAIAALELTDADRAEIAAARAGATPVPGEVYALERDRGGRHGAIMKYDLNEAAT